MALMKCPECGHQVSDTADTCPECGYCISQYVHQEKLKAKRKIVDSNPSIDDSWVAIVEKHVKKNFLVPAIMFPASFVLFVICDILFFCVLALYF